jgi:hypothetical protein
MYDRSVPRWGIHLNFSGKTKNTRASARTLTGTAAVLLLVALITPLPSASAGWSQESTVSPVLLNSAPTLKVAGDPDTLLVAAWMEVGSPGYNVWYSARVGGGPWSTPIKSARSQMSVSVLDVSVSAAAGTALVTWSEGSGAFGSGPLKAALYTTAGGWAAPANLDGGGVSVLDAHSAIDASGRIVVVWAQMVSSTFTYSAWGRTYASGSGWSAPAQIDAGNYPNQARIATSPAGAFTAVIGAQGHVTARSFTFGGGWGNMSSALDGGNVNDPTIAVTEDASAVVAWRDYTTNPASIYANRNAQGLGWQGAVRLADPSNGSSDPPLLSAGGGGNVTLYWTGNTGSGVDLLATRMSNGAGWSPTFAIDTGAQPVTAAQIVSASDGTMRAVWTQGDSTSVTVWSAAQDSSGAWGPPALVECRLAAASAPAIAIGPGGHAVAVWAFGEYNTFKIWWNAFDSASTESLGAFAVTAPAEGASVGSPSVWVAGTARSDASLSVNGQAGAVAPNGSFGLLVNLAPGANALNFTLTFPCGVTRFAVVNVTYADPVGPQLAALAAALNGTSSEVTAAKADLAALGARITALETAVDAQGTDLDASAAELGRLNASLEASQARLDGAELRIAAAEAAVASLHTSSNGSDAQVAQLWASLGSLHDDLNATSAQVEGARFNLTHLDGQVSALQTTQASAQRAAPESSSALTLLLAAIAAGAVGLFLGRRRPPMDRPANDSTLDAADQRGIATKPVQKTAASEPPKEE